MSLSETARDRIVGAVFLLSLAGILLPMWFDGAGVRDLPDVSTKVAPVVGGTAPAPVRTEGDAWKFTEPMEAAAKSGSAAPLDAGEQAQIGEPRTRDAEHATSAVGPGGAELPWTVQVASLSSLDAGKQLKDRLLAGGFHAYLTQVKRSDGTLSVRVAVGPIVDKGEADRVRAELQAKFGLQGMLKRFDL